MSDEIIEDPKRLFTLDEIFDRAKTYLDTHESQEFHVSTFALYSSVELAGYFKREDWKGVVEVDAAKKGIQITWGPNLIILRLDAA